MYVTFKLVLHRESARKKYVGPSA